MNTSLPAPAWPPDDLFVPVPERARVSQSGARCDGVAICDDSGNSTLCFQHGQWAHVFFECEVLEDIGAPVGGAEFHTRNGLLIHGRNTFHHCVPVPEHVAAGTRLRVRQSFRLDVAAGHYGVNLGLSTVPADILAKYQRGEVPFADLIKSLRVLCRVDNAAFFIVAPPPDDSLPHHGLVNLPGSAAMELATGTAFRPRVPQSASPGAPPTLFHVTHWKAGSQWLYGILRSCAPDAIVAPQLNDAQFRYHPIRPGSIYPTLYLDKPAFDKVSLPPNSKTFVVIRDLRDALVSAYFSFRYSHPVTAPEHVATRARLNSLDQESGLLFLVDDILPAYAQIQLSWLESEVPILKYEDLLQHDEELLSALLIERFGLPVSRECLHEAVVANRFEKISGGRAAGSEDITAHARMGVAGNWRKYFTDRLRKAFKMRYGGLLAATGYESDLSW